MCETKNNEWKASLNNPHDLTKPVFVLVSNRFAWYLATKWQHFVIIQRIKILFHNVYNETLLIFRSKKLNIGKVFLFSPVR